jgi:hypothetical protein
VEKALDGPQVLPHDIEYFFRVATEVFLSFCRVWLSDKAVSNAQREEIKTGADLILRLNDVSFTKFMSKESEYFQIIFSKLPIPETRTPDIKQARTLVNLDL